MLLHLQEIQLVPHDRKKENQCFKRGFLNGLPALYARAVSLTVRRTKKHLLNKNEQINECNSVSRHTAIPYSFTLTKHFCKTVRHV